MKKFTRLCFLVLLSVATTVVPSNAQNRVTMNGKVTAEDSKTPVAYAVINIPDAGVQTSTDINGEFHIKSLNRNDYKVIISFIGYETLETSADMKSGKTNFEFILKPANFRVDDVIVTAESSKAGDATASKISRTAMDHIQATSIADVLNLLPGSTVPTSSALSLSSQASFSIRGGSSLGTAIIMDGAPMSNNANMQNMTSAISLSMANNASTTAKPTSGIDLRQISTDNIESIEVIRGVASATYGDITSGAVLVNSKAGASPFNLKLQMNPNLYQLSAIQGIGLGKGRGGALNYSADYTYSQYNPTEGYAHYQRINGKVGYTQTIGKWYTNSSFSVGIYRDKAKPNPDDTNDNEYSLEKENTFRFNTNGAFNFNKGWFKNIQYTAAFSLADKHSYLEDLAGNAEWSFSTSKTDGSILSSVTGKPIYLDDGSVLVDGNSSDKAWKTPNAYKYAYNIYGKELDTYAQVKANFAGNIGRTSHRIVIGGDFKNDGNTGRGKVYDPDYPPYRNLSWDYATQRERSYDDVPFMNTLGLFAEETFNWNFARRNLRITAGVRYDKVFNFDSNVAPRINASFEVIPDHLFIRGGYGVTAKTPTLALLYPQEAYFDILNFDNSKSSTVPEDQRFQVITTRVFDTKNYGLKMATAKKYEVGFDFKIGQVKGAVTAYKDCSSNGYSIGVTDQSIQRVDVVQYQSAATADNPYILKQASSTSSLLRYSTPTNNAAYETRGIEAEIDFGRINAIRTRFILDGQWYRNESWSNGYSFARAYAGNVSDHMGIYAPGIKHDFYEILASNLKAVHNIPQIGFVITVTANVVWRERTWSVYQNDEIPIKYISAADGKIYDFEESMFEQDEFKMLDTRKEQDERRNIRDSYRTPMLCMNINVTKEIKDFLRISFYANNAFRSTPLWESTKDPGSFTRRNANTFFFGLSLTAIIK